MDRETYKANRVNIWTDKIMRWLDGRKDSIPSGQGAEFTNKIIALPKDTPREIVFKIVKEHLDSRYSQDIIKMEMF